MKAGYGSLICFLVSLSFIVISTSTEIPQDLLKSHYDGRSGDISIYNKDSNTVLGSVSFINSQKFPSTGAIPETEVADLITHFNGLPAFQSNRDRANFPPTNFFSKPKANVFFYVQNPSSFELEPTANSQTFTLSRESYYSTNSTLPQLTTLVTGVTPATHGIISDNFVDRVAGYPSSSISRAYDSWTQGIVHSANIADLWTLNFQGKSLVMSFADSKQVSSAMNAKPVVVEDEVSGNYGYYLKSDKVETIYDHATRLLINKEHIKTFYENTAPCGLSFDDATDFALIAEIAVPQLMMKALNVPGSEYAKYTHDEIPDLFSFGFTSLKNFGSKHGLQSTAMQCAIRQVDFSIANVLSTINQVYGENIIAQVTTINVDSPTTTTTKPEPTYGLIKAQLKNLVDNNSTVKQLLPHIYLNEQLTVTKIGQLVDKLNKALQGTGYEAVQMPVPHFEMNHVAYKFVESKRQLTATNSTMSHAGVLQTCLWTGIGLGVAILGASYFMFTIDPSTDPVLYQHDINHPTSTKGF